MNKAGRISKAINDAFYDELKKAFKREFGVEIASTFNIVKMVTVSNRKDGKKLSQKQREWIEAFETGYFAAFSIVIGQS